MTVLHLTPGHQPYNNPGYIPVLCGWLDVWTIEPGDELLVQASIPKASYTKSLARLLNHYSIAHRVEDRGEYLAWVFQSKARKITAIRRRTMPYDRILAPEILRLVRERRTSPPKGTRFEIGTQETRTGPRRIYPWALMDVGDYFEIELETATRLERDRLWSVFAPSAARHDFEIAIQPFYTEREGEYIPSLRVTYVLGNVSRYKIAALTAAGKRVPASLKDRTNPISAERIGYLKRNFIKWALELGYNQVQAIAMFGASPLSRAYDAGPRRPAPRVYPSAPDAARPPIVDPPDPLRPVSALDTIGEIESQASDRGRGEGQLDDVDHPEYDRAEILRRRLAALMEE